MTENTLIVLKDESVAKFEFNFEELKKWALEKVEKYQNLMVTEDQVIDIKKEMADINKYAKEIDAKRKEEAAKPAPMEAPAPLVEKEQPKPEPKKEEILGGRVRFTFKESNLEQIRNLMNQIKALCETWENE